MSKKRTTVLSVQDVQKLKKGEYSIRHVADKDIDFSDIPELTDEQLKKFKRVGRPIIEINRTKTDRQSAKKTKP